MVAGSQLPSLETTSKLSDETLLTIHNIFTRRANVESRWDSKKYTNASFLGKRQRGEGPRVSILMEIKNLKIRSLFNKLSLGITLVVRNRESGSNSYQERSRSGRCLVNTIEEKHLLRLRLILKGAASRQNNLNQQTNWPNCIQEKDRRGSIIPSGRLAEGEVLASSHCTCNRILSKREIGDIHSACDEWMNSTWGMLSFSKAFRCCRGLLSVWRSGKRLGRSAICSGPDLARDLSTCRLRWQYERDGRRYHLRS